MQISNRRSEITRSGTHNIFRIRLPRKCGWVVMVMALLVNVKTITLYISMFRNLTNVRTGIMKNIPYPQEIDLLL